MNLYKTLPPGKMAVYMFYYKREFLKIGKVGPNSNARFQSQHYNPGSANSNLAKSMLDDPDNPWNGCDESNIGDWIKLNTDRINIYLQNIYLEEKHRRSILNLFEAVLQCKYSPKYEES